jgi:hypothetical protein
VIRLMPCFVLAVLLGAGSAPAVAGPDCLLDYPVGLFVSHSFTDARGTTHRGTNDGVVYSQLSGRLRASGASVVEIGASSGKEALERAKDQASLLAFFELIAHARPVALPGGQRTSWQDVRLEASLRIIDAVGRRQLGSATDMVTAAGLDIEDALQTSLPGLMGRLTTMALTQTCARPELLPAKPARALRVAQRAKPDLETAQKALGLISDTASKLCQDIPLDSSSKIVDLSGKAKADVSWLLKGLVDFGIDGAGQYRQEESRNVLQKDLASALATSTDCKLQVLRILQDRLLPGGG